MPDDHLRVGLVSGRRGRTAALHTIPAFDLGHVEVDPRDGRPARRARHVDDVAVSPQSILEALPGQQLERNEGAPRGCRAAPDPCRRRRRQTRPCPAARRPRTNRRTRTHGDQCHGSSIADPAAPEDPPDLRSAPRTDRRRRSRPDPDIALVPSRPRDMVCGIVGCCTSCRSPSDITAAVRAALSCRCCQRSWRGTCGGLSTVEAVETVEAMWWSRASGLTNENQVGNHVWSRRRGDSAPRAPGAIPLTRD